MIVAERSLREGTPALWQQESHQVTHTVLGGVTNWRATLHCYTRTSPDQAKGREVIFFKPEFLVGAPNSLKNITDRTIQGRPFTPPSTSSADNGMEKVTQPTTLELRALQRTGAGRAIHAKLPSVFSPTKWCTRALTDTEIASILDLPGAIIRSWNTPMLQAINRQLQTPVKVTALLARCIREMFRNMAAKHRASTKRNLKTRDGSHAALGRTESATVDERDTKCMRIASGDQSSPSGESVSIPVTWAALTIERMQA
ncbi:hypothetical protein ACA910_001133 [Epithemia clementina (nom. ined.)]